MNRTWVFLLCVMLAGCATTIQQATAVNRKNLLQLSVGMTREQAISVMGTEDMRVHYFQPYGTPRDRTAVRINNPYRSEIMRAKDRTFEIIYYVTDVKKDDAAITDDELTPLVFENGKLAGWGQGFLQDNVQRYEVRIR